MSSQKSALVLDLTVNIEFCENLMHYYTVQEAVLRIAGLIYLEDVRLCCEEIFKETCRVSMFLSNLNVCMYFSIMSYYYL